MSINCLQFMFHVGKKIQLRRLYIYLHSTLNKQGLHKKTLISAVKKNKKKPYFFLLSERQRYFLNTVMMKTAFPTFKKNERSGHTENLNPQIFLQVNNSLLSVAFQFQSASNNNSVIYFNLKLMIILHIASHV